MSIWNLECCFTLPQIGMGIHKTGVSLYCDEVTWPLEHILQTAVLPKKTKSYTSELPRQNKVLSKGKRMGNATPYWTSVVEAKRLGAARGSGHGARVRGAVRGGYL